MHRSQSKADSTDWENTLQTRRRTEAIKPRSPILILEPITTPEKLTMPRPRSATQAGSAPFTQGQTGVGLGEKAGLNSKQKAVGEKNQNKESGKLLLNKHMSQEKRQHAEPHANIMPQNQKFREQKGNSSRKKEMLLEWTSSSSLSTKPGRM
jgi:hypothetical protein